MKTSTKIYFVRHGEYLNPKQIFPGRLSGFGLNEEGCRQAGSAANALRAKNVVAVFSSPLLRARQTARFILLEYPNLKLHTSRYLIEVYCPFDGRPLAEIRARNWDVFTGIGAPYEQPEDVLKRAKLFVTKVRQEFYGKHVIAVTHGDVIACLKLWSMNKSLTTENKQIDYPTPASIHTFIFHGLSENEIPTYEYPKPF